MSDTSLLPTRQAERERAMSASRPYETYPFHPPALFTPYTKINFSMYSKLFQVVLSCGICIVFWNILRFFIYACALSEPLISRFSAMLKSCCPLCRLALVRRDTAIKTRRRCVAIWRLSYLFLNYIVHDIIIGTL